MLSVIKRIVKLMIIISWALMFQALPALAVDAGPKLKSRGAGYFMFGGSFLDIGRLSTELERSGYSALSGDFFTLGGGAHVVIGRLVLGGEGHGFSGKSSGNARFTTTLSGGCGFFNLGYVLYSGKGLQVYPICGLGAGSITLDITDRQTASFEDVLNDPGRSTRLSTSGFLLNLGLEAGKLIGFGSLSREKGGLLIGVRAGYTFAPVKGGWELEKMEIEGGPGTAFAGPYIRLIIGVGGR